MFNECQKIKMLKKNKKVNPVLKKKKKKSK